MMLVTRAEWGARPPTSTPAAITSQGTTGHWEGGGLWGGVIGPHDSCAPKVRAIQAYHMDSNGWTDIAYNALGCPHGYVFEGRGPGRRSAANGTNYSNGVSAVVCYLGGQGDPLTAEGERAMVDASVWLLGDLVWGHRDWFNTTCPGDAIYNWIKAGHPTVPPQGGDMTPGQCRDKAPAGADGGANRKWFFYVGEDQGLWARVPTSTPVHTRLGGVFTSGVQAMCEDNGLLVICGRALDGQLQQCIVYTDGNTVQAPGTPPFFELLGGTLHA